MDVLFSWWWLVAAVLFSTTVRSVRGAPSLVGCWRWAFHIPRAFLTVKVLTVQAVLGLLVALWSANWRDAWLFAVALLVLLRILELEGERLWLQSEVTALRAGHPSAGWGR